LLNISQWRKIDRPMDD